LWVYKTRWFASLLANNFWPIANQHAIWFTLSCESSRRPIFISFSQTSGPISMRFSLSCSLHWLEGALKVSKRWWLLWRCYVVVLSAVVPGHRVDGRRRRDGLLLLLPGGQELAHHGVLQESHTTGLPPSCLLIEPCWCVTVTADLWAGGRYVAHMDQ